MKDFQAALKAANEHRKQNGKPIATAAIVGAACALRGWHLGEFRSWSEMQASLSPERFQKLTKEINENPLRFELEEKVRIEE
jgi:hypothetical protein